MWGRPRKDAVSGREGLGISRPLTVISSHRGWFDWRLRQLWGCRDLISLFVRRDFVTYYKQTILGPAWHVFQPLLTTLTYTVIFGKLAALPTDGAPPFLFYMVGSVAWNYFAASLNKTASTFIANADLLGKVYFHRLAIPVSVVISNLIAFGIQLGTLLVILIAFSVSGDPVHMTAFAFLTPVYLLMLAGYALSGGIIVCALTTRYRDLIHLITFGVQLLMYATPVIYPVSAVPERYRWVAELNPLTPVMEGFRLGFLGVGTVDMPQLAASFGIMLVLLSIGVMLFSHVERTFMDTV
jgi:lipopolysaccharide transport system permease protein